MSDCLLGENVFFADLKSKSVKSGVVLSSIVSQSGYVVHIILDEAKVKYSVEKARVFLSQKEAEEYLPNMLSVADEMERLEQANVKLLESLRQKIIGKPEFKELADVVFNQRKN